MKNNIIKTLALGAVLITLNLNAQTNDVAESGKEFGGWEFTLGGDGEAINGERTFGLDFSLSTNPLEFRPEVWVGVAQGLYWDSVLAGSTDLFIDWSQHLFDELYLNVGWSGGALYGKDAETVWRTGPEVTLQYYTSDNSFVFAGLNYDLFKSDDEDEGKFRYSLGLGLSF